MPRMFELERDTGKWVRGYCLTTRRKTSIRIEIGVDTFSGCDDLTVDEAMDLRDWLSEAINLAAQSQAA